MLGQMGADVIKIESLEGDTGRRLGSYPLPEDAQWGPVFYQYNHHKRFMALDLKSERGREVALRLAATADVIVENFRPGVMDRLGLGYDVVKASNPGIVYCSLTAFTPGIGSPERRGVDLVLQAESGIMTMTGFADREPVKVGFTIVDSTAAYVLTQSILGGLLNKERTGAGTHVSVSLHEVAMHLQAAPIGEYLITGKQQERHGNAAPISAPADLFPTEDGYMVISSYTPEHWRQLCECLALTDMLQDPRFASMSLRVVNRKAMWDRLAALFVTDTTEHWVSLLVNAGLSAGRVRGHAEVVAEQLGDPRGILAGSGEATYFRLPAVFEGMTEAPGPAEPVDMRVGRDSREVLAELGYPAEDIESLVASRVCRVPVGQVAEETTKR